MPTPEIRALFPCTSELTYLNTAAFGPGPQPVMQAVLRSLRDWSSGRGDWRDWEGAGEDARNGSARMLGVEPECIALLGTAAAAAAQVLHALPDPSLGRDVLIVGDGEFRSNLFPWAAGAERGFELRTVPFRDGRLDAEELAAAIDERTALVAASLVQSANGYRLPLAPVQAACRLHGARLFIDATQCMGALRIDMSGIDYLAAAGYKWLFAPRGTALLYAAPQHAATMSPLAPNWKTPADPYADYYGLPMDAAPRASRLDHSLAWNAWVGAAAGIRLLNEVGVDKIEEHGLALAGRFRAGLERMDWLKPSPLEEHSQVVGVEVPDPQSVSDALATSGIVASVRGRYLRTSFALFNDTTDVDRALETLAQV